MSVATCPHCGRDDVPVCARCGKRVPHGYTAGTWLPCPCPERPRPELTFCLGFKNRNLQHLDRCLASIRRMTDEPIHVVYLSDASDILAVGEPPTGLRVAPETELDRVRALCLTQGARLAVHLRERWSRSVALNVAARKATTPGLVFTDADMVFEPKWREVVRTAMAEFEEKAAGTPLEGPLLERVMLLTPSRDTDEGYRFQDLLERPTELLEKTTSRHPDTGQGAATIVSRAWFERVRGFDETYETWGSEDNDLVERARWDGRIVGWLSGSFVVHQWHRRDWATEQDWTRVEAGRAYLAERLAEKGPIVRNPNGWGGLDG